MLPINQDQLMNLKILFRLYYLVNICKQHDTHRKELCKKKNKGGRREKDAMVGGVGEFRRPATLFSFLEKVKMVST